MKLVISILLLSLSVGCLGAVRVVDAREQFAQSHQAVKERAASALAAAASAQRLMRRLADLVDNMQQSPLPELRRQAGALEAAAKTLRAQTRSLQRLRNRLEKLGRGRTELRDGEKGWKLYHTLVQDRLRLERQSKDGFDLFSRQENEFRARSKKAGIGPVNTDGYGDRMGKKIKAMDVLLKRASAQHANVESLLNSEGVDPGHLRRVQAATVQLEAMTEARTEARRTALRFRLETKAGAQALIAPGMVTFDLFKRLDNLLADMTAASSRIDELVKDLPVME
jgi:hypothetical protein